VTTNARPLTIAANSVLDSNLTVRQNSRDSMPSEPPLINVVSEPSRSSPLENYVQPTLGHGLRIWWAYYWPTSLVSLFIIVFLTFLLRKAWENVLISAHVVLWSSRILPYVVVYGFSVFTIRYVLRKSFRSFRVALLPRDRLSGTEAMSRSFALTLRVWWAFCWRTVVYSLIVRFAGSVALGFTIGILSSMSRAAATLVPIIAQVVIDGAVGLFVIYSAILDEEFGDFRVALLPREPAVGVVPATTESSLAQ
jgi:hypothetical protein